MSKWADFVTVGLHALFGFLIRKFNTSCAWGLRVQKADRLEDHYKFETSLGNITNEPV